jgi:hypothetical protein
LKENVEKNSEEKTGRPSEIALKFFPEGARKIEKRYRGEDREEEALALFSGSNPTDFVVRSPQNLRTKFLGQMGRFFRTATWTFRLIGINPRFCTSFFELIRVFEGHFCKSSG